MSLEADRKLFLGARLKRLRRERGLTQTAMAGDLGVSPSYLNHIERNQRPVTAQLLLRLAETYDVDLRSLGQAGPAGEQALAEVLADPLFQGLDTPRHELLTLTEEAPGAAEAILRLYRAFTEQRDRARAALIEGAAAEGPSPSDWVRDWIQARSNYFPELDGLGETLHASLDPTMTGEGCEALARARLAQRHNLTVKVMPAEVMVEWTRRFDPHRRRLLLSETLDPSSRAFSIVYQLALAEHEAELNAMVEAA
ncbi:MAG: helix-turn-helix domain-containing protein, partial [Caulobacteraceae bacterium]|nr:helix-turn-helix domain-containing protein [Caulobacteraceae bacterium]